MLVTPNVAIFVFAVILLISAIIAWRMGMYANYDKGGFHTFIAILTGLGVFVTFMFYYNIVQLQNQQQQLAAVQELARINDSILNSVLEEMQQASVMIPNFVLSITPLTNTTCCDSTGCVGPIGEDPVNPQTCTEKMVLSYRIFSLWQDELVTIGFTNGDRIAYIANFLQRANSTLLYNEWVVSKLNFAANTQTFGDLLFKYGLPITVQTPASYVAAANALIADPAYKSIC